MCSSDLILQYLLTLTHITISSYSHSLILQYLLTLTHITISSYTHSLILQYLLSFLFSSPFSQVGPSEQYLRHEAHARTFNPCDQKLTPQLERKRYFEEKARDARDEYDDLNLINDSMVRPRVISAAIGFGPGSGSNNLDPKQMKILRFELYRSLFYYTL